MIKLLIIIFAVILIDFHRTSAIAGNVNATVDTKFSTSSSLVEINNRIGKFQCYGLLISDSWVLSRANCLNGNYCHNDELYRLKFGLANGVNVVEVNTTRFLVHAYYRNSEGGAINNIALIHLPSKLILNEFIAPLQLPVIIGGKAQKNHSGLLLTFMRYWFDGNIFTRLMIRYTRVSSYLQWIHDVTLIQ